MRMLDIGADDLSDGEVVGLSQAPMTAMSDDGRRIPKGRALLLGVLRLVSTLAVS